MSQEQEVMGDLPTATGPGGPSGPEPASSLGQRRSSPIAWDEDVAFILGRPCFMFIREAQLFRSLGYVIPKQAEAEQAFFIHRWLNFYLQHGADWRNVANDDIRDHIQRAKLAE